MLHKILHHTVIRNSLVGLLLIALILTTFSASASIIPQVGERISSQPQSTGQPTPFTSSAIDDLTVVDVLGAQSIAPSHFIAGAATVKSAGANFVHFGIEWDDLAPTDIEPAAYNWTAYDSQMDLAASLGYEIMITMGHNPLWAASFRRGPVDCVPLTRFTDYVSAVVTRYSASPYNVKYWALYNEPDVVGFTRPGYTDCSGDSWAYAFGDDNVKYNGLTGPEHYAAHLQAAYTTIKAIDANATVMNGGVAYDFFDSEGGVFNEDFLDQIFTAGAGSYMDAMNFHYYPEYDWRWEGVTGLPGIIAKTHMIRVLLATHGLDKPFVCSELGDSSGFGGADTRTQDTQAIAVVKQFARAIASGNKIGIWYNMSDYSGDLNFGEHGLLDYPSFAAKLSLDAYATLATYLPGYSFARVLSSTEMGATNLEGYLFWDLANNKELYILWSKDGSAQTINLPSGVSSVVDKFDDAVSYDSTLAINKQPALITRDITTHLLYLPLILR